MNWSLKGSLVLMSTVCVIGLSACSGGGGAGATMPAVFTLAPTVPAAVTAAPRLALPAATTPVATTMKPEAGKPASQPPTGAAGATATARPAQPGPVPTDINADAADQALQQLSTDLGNVDTVPEVNSAGDVTATQGLDELSKSLANTDTLKDLGK